MWSFYTPACSVANSKVPCISTEFPKFLSIFYSDSLYNFFHSQCTAKTGSVYYHIAVLRTYLHKCNYLSLLSLKSSSYNNDWTKTSFPTHNVLQKLAWFTLRESCPALVIQITLISDRIQNYCNAIAKESVLDGFTVFSLPAHECPYYNAHF